MRDRALCATLAIVSACGGGVVAPAPRPPTPTSAPAPPAAVAPAAPADDLAAKIDPIFAAFTAHTPGCIAGVFRAGEVVYAKGYGLANLEHDIPLTPTTTIEIGSTSKQFTATAILLLVQGDKLQGGPWGKSHMRSDLDPRGHDSFASPGFALAFERDARGRVVGMTGVFGGYRGVHWTKR